MVQQVIEDIRLTYVPDKRVATFEVSATPKNGQILLTGETSIPEAKSLLLQQLQNVGMKYIDSIKLLPDEQLDGMTYGVVNLSVCNIRSNPKHAAELATQASLGTPLRILKREGEWYKVQTPDKYLGWLDIGGFTLMNRVGYDDWLAQPKTMYKNDFGFSFQQPDLQSLRVSDLVAGNILVIDSIGEIFTKVVYPDKRIAYIPNHELRDYNTWIYQDSIEIAQLITDAHRLIGRPYLWGGTSEKGMDCSGFTKTVYFMNGLMLPRDASQQVHVGVAVAYDTTWQNLLPGDFLFFGQKATAEQKEKITHVAIYLGNGKIIHSSGTVKIESLKRGDPDFNEYRFNTFVRAKRMTENIGENGVLYVKDIAAYKLSKAD
jgi:hypothetical protein